MVTTLKENGLANAAFQSWSSFTREGDGYYVIMSGIMKHTHTYANIKRDKEFCVNFHLHNPMNPFTGNYFGGGAGTIQYAGDM